MTTIRGLVEDLNGNMESSLNGVSDTVNNNNSLLQGINTNISEINNSIASINDKLTTMDTNIATILSRLTEINNINNININDVIYNLNAFKSQHSGATQEDKINYIITYLKEKNFVRTY